MPKPTTAAGDRHVERVVARHVLPVWGASSVAGSPGGCFERAPGHGHDVRRRGALNQKIQTPVMEINHAMNEAKCILKTT